MPRLLPRIYPAKENGMNSDQERALFLSYGWEYNYIRRVWVSPDGTKEIGLDFLVQLTQEPEGDLRLMRAIVEWGERRG